MRIRPEVSEVCYGDTSRTGYRVLTAEEAAQVRSAMRRYRWGSGIVVRDALLKGTYETANGVKETLPPSRHAWTVSGRSVPWRRDKY